MDLATADPDTLRPEALIAHVRLQRRIAQVRGLRGLEPNAQVGLRTDSFWPRTFEDTPRDGEQLRAGASWIGDRFAARAQLSLVPDPDFEVDNEWRLDGSYLAGAFGNHILYAGAIDRWWGPGYDDTLIFSSNARPVGGLGLQRSVALPFESRWLSWIGPWNYSLFWGFLESNREVPNARLLAFRFGFRPTNDVEIGITRTAQWCGQGQDCSFSALQEVIVGDSSNEPAGDDPKPFSDNQLFALDLRWQSPFSQGPWAFYLQAVAEDEAGGAPSRFFGQFGLETWGSIDTRYVSGSWRGHLEWTNSVIHFWRNDSLYNLAYEHGLYRSGYRYKGRSMGAGLDGDSEVLSAGLTLIDDRGQTWNGLLRVGDINQRGRGLGNDLRHSVSPEELSIVGMQLSHVRPLRHNNIDLGKLSVGLGVLYADNQATGNSATDVQAFVQWTWDYSGL